MVELEDENENYTDEEVDQVTHNKLLSAVSRIYKKQRVEKPKRSEPYLNVSEFHLANSENNAESEKVEVYDLVNVLEKKSSHKQIKSKFESVINRSTKLPKPLEKIYEDRVKRSVGYEHLKNHVSRWSSLIDQNRTAPQLSFPIKNDSDVKVYKPLEFLSTFKEPTELEKDMAEVLKESAVAQQDSKVEEAIFNLSIPEMIQKRKLVSKLKAKESFQIVKAMKQNKIKSKKYRRIMRKEKMKQELKDFETLQRTDPEAALEKLNKLEKERAEERASLRHRNTGKWAQGQAIRAKYDVEARIQLAEQIAKSRELTQKRKLAEDNSSDTESDEEEGDEVEENQINSNIIDNDNPWMQENVQNQQQPEETIDEFISGYQSYWKSKKNEPKSKLTINKAALARLVGKDVKKSAVPVDEAVVSHVIGKNSAIEIINVQKTSGDSKSEGIVNPPSEDNLNVDPSESSKFSKPDKFKSNSNNSLKNSVEKLSNTQSIKNIEKPPTVASNSDELLDTSNNTTVLNKKQVDISHFISSEKGVGNKKRKLKGKIQKNVSIKNTSGVWKVDPTVSCVVPDVNSSNKISAKITNQSLEDMFDNMEDSLQAKVKERLKKFDEIVFSDEEEITVKKKKRKTKQTNKLVRPEKKVMNETNVLEDEHDEELEDLLKIVNDNDTSKTQESENKGKNKEPTIDPNKFLNVKPRVLNTQLPDMIIEGDDDIVDDPEDDRRVKISEAFAEDDVVEEFKREKEKEINSGENQDVDLFLPGWGSWGGPNINAQTKKKKRFFIKAPPIKRKDSSKPNVIINEDISNKYKEHMVSDVPYPFTSVRAYEATIRAPIGSTWVPETAVHKLTLPAVIKKMGTIIEPMSEAQLVKNDRTNARLKVNNIKSIDGTGIK